ncbi:Stf0 sulfotransferase family protein [Paenibacillus sp. sptzw28]|uniref:Stf0 family sulfotransferase n=1 Tax=Paenibacillus sp. sptzw28 TaxID=715179 RepID=UPI001C6F3979|nr:Stf0 family sulfotransferase [Paenibacillus sp. sptzw28]QYR22363.1 Stf0 sulfotransferase family protein [Paenibacillus sp. sptzw28]
MKPEQCYTIWFSQRTGSTLLNTALASTGVAGNPGEWLHGKDPKRMTREDLEQMWKEGASPSGIFGLKTSFNAEWLSAFRNIFQLPQTATRPSIWRAAFPNCNKHIYMTRRNKVRLAVSWWRAIVSGEWHRRYGEKPQEHDIAGQYNFDAINHLYIECSLREAALEDFFSEEGIVPLTIVYEDFILEYEATVLRVLEFLNIKTDSVKVAPPALDKLADDIAEQWVQRYRQERQAGWERLAW